MKTIGILGGMGPASTSYYYDTLCRLTRERLGGNTSPQLLIYSYDFAQNEDWLKTDRGDLLEASFAETGDRLITAGADMMMIATNTMHQFADTLAFRWGVPLLDVRSMVGLRLKADERKTPALLGTAFTMQQEFYKDAVSRWAEAGVMVPDAAEQDDIQAIIFDELVKGIFSETGTTRFLEITENLKARGADSIILGCTEIGLIMNDENSALPTYDTALIHCEEAIDMACSDWSL